MPNMGARKENIDIIMPNMFIKDLSQYSKIKFNKNWDGPRGSANACSGGFDHFCGGNADRWGYYLRWGIWWATICTR